MIRTIALALTVAAISTSVASAQPAEPKVPTGWTSRYPLFAEDIKKLGTEGTLKKFLQIGKPLARPLESYTETEFHQAYQAMGFVPLYGPVTIPAPLSEEQITASRMAPSTR
jgi:hypothetical protein